MSDAKEDIEELLNISTDRVCQRLMRGSEKQGLITREHCQEMYDQLSKRELTVF